MKSRALCYDPALARMQVKRFFPIWILYCGGMALLEMMLMLDANNDVSLVINAHAFIQMTGLINLIYGVVMAQLLFGDLYTARLCYALHSLPTTRGGIFGTQIILGLLGSVLPNLGLMVLMLPFLGSYQYLAFWWFYASAVQFFCFYGISVFSIMCAGNRIGMLIVNGIIQLFSVLLYWFVVHVYNPLLFGLPVKDTWFFRFSPAFQMIFESYIQTVSEGVETSGVWTQVIKELVYTDTWKLLPAYALVGGLSMYLAMRMYRKRNLECCGDLLSFRRGHTFFLVLLSLGCSCVMHIFAASEFPQYTYLFLMLGLALGWFAGLMLLQRQVNVFHWKRFVQLGLLAAAFLLTMLVTATDPLNRVHQLPEEDQIVSAKISRYLDYLSAEAPAEEVLEIHKMILEDYDQTQQSYPLLKRLMRSKERGYESVIDAQGNYHETSLMYILYTMKDGSTFQRQYAFSDMDQCYAAYKKLASRPENVFVNADGKTPADYRAETQLMTLECTHFYAVDVQSAMESINAQKRNNHPIQVIQSREEMNGLWEAYLADCQLGVTAQDWIFSRGYSDTLCIYTIENAKDPRFWMPITDECVNTLNWLVDHGYHDPLPTTP